MVVGVASYYASMLLVAEKLKPFQANDQTSRRLRVLCWAPYFTDGILAGLGGWVNPLGLFYVIASALPSTLGANAGLLSLPSMMRRMSGSSVEQVGPIRRSPVWIAAAAVASLQHPHISWMFLVGVLIWGWFGYKSMPQRKDPEIPCASA